MAKVLLINGSPHQFGCTYTALSEAAHTLEKNGVETEILWIGTKAVNGCIDCGKCVETGRCVFDDLVNRIIDKIDETDGFIVGSPVYYGGAAGQLCCVLDRLFFAASGKLAGKPAAAVVSCRRGGASAAFERLNMYFSNCSMPIVTSQYWNQVHGFTPEDVRRDEEGLQTMRTLAQNMAWMIKNLGGSEKPVYEEHLWTHFIMPE